MLISTHHKFIFIHVPKTAGSAIHKSLQPYSRPVNRTLFRSFLRRMPIIESVDKAHFRIHERAAAVQSKLSASVWNAYFSFGVVRNPFDHAVSHYEYLKQYRNNRIASYFSTVTFDEYLSYRISPKGKFDRVFLKLPAQNAFLCKNNRVIVDRVFKFENISNLESDLCNRFPGLEINLQRVNVTRSKRDRAVNEYFQNRKTLDKFMHLYEKDFELFDYSTAI